VRDEVRAPKRGKGRKRVAARIQKAAAEASISEQARAGSVECWDSSARMLSLSYASLRCPRDALGELLDLGPGDVVQLDRNIRTRRLIVGDKMWRARSGSGERELWPQGNRSWPRPKKRLESIRCLFKREEDGGNLHPTPAARMLVCRRPG